MSEKSSNHFLFIDVETNGLPLSYNKPYTDIDNWPRIVQIAWIICDNKNEVITERCFIIKPIDFDIPDSIVKVHGISKQIALAKGLPIEVVLSLLEEESKKCTHFVAHNIAFDAPIIKAEFLRANLVSSLNDKTEICTMQSSIEYCGFTNNKYPKLEELYFKLFNRKPENLHDALQDIRYTKDCFFVLLQKGIIELDIDNKFYDPFLLRLEVPKIIPYRKRDLFGYCNQEGRVIIECKYDNVTWFNNEIAFVKRESKYAIIDKFGELITPFNMFGPYAPHIPNLACVSINGEIQYYDELNKKLKKYLKVVYCFENKIFARLENKSVWLDKNFYESKCIYEDVTDVDYYKKYAIVKLANKFGVIDEDINEIVPCYYDSITIRDSFIYVYKNNKSGLLKNNGSQILPCIYDQIDAAEYTYKYGFVKAAKNDKYGFLDSNGNILTDFKYDEYEGGTNRFTVVKINNKCGLVFNGIEIIKCSFEDCVFNDNIAGVLLNEKWAVFDKLGNQKSGFIFDKLWHWRQLDPDDEGGKFLMIDSHGFIVKFKDKYGYVNNKGIYVLSAVYDDIEEFIREDSILLRVKINNKWGICDDSGNVLFDCILSECTNWFRSKRIVISKNNKVGIIDNSGVLLIDFKYDEIVELFYGADIALVKLNLKFGLIDKYNKTILDCVYDEIKVLKYSNNRVDVFKVKINNKWGCINTNCDTIIDCKYDSIDSIYGDILKVDIKNKYGLIDILGNEIVPIHFDCIERISEEEHKINQIVFKVKLHDKFGLVDSKNNLIIICKYDSIDYNAYSNKPFWSTDYVNRQAVNIEGLIYVKLNSKQGYVNIMNGKEYFEG